MKSLLSLLITFFISFNANSQQPKLWTDADRNFLLDNLKRSRDELQKETANLTEKQWNFKETPDRWSIKQVVEHICIWELLLQREINLAYEGGPKPEMAATAAPDSAILKYLADETPHIATEYTKPFTFTVPMGLTDGKTNVAWFTKMRNESIDFLTTTTEDIRLYFGRPRRSMHFAYISTFAHTDRHLKQIRKIKSHPAYPR